MLEWPFGGDRNNGRKKNLQESALEVSQLLEKSKNDEFEGTRLSKALILLAKARDQCEEFSLEEIIKEAGDLIAEALENMQERIKNRKLRLEKIQRESR